MCMIYTVCKGKEVIKQRREYLRFMRRVKSMQLGTNYKGELISLSPVQIKKLEQKTNHQSKDVKCSSEVDGKQGKFYNYPLSIIILNYPN